MATQIFPNTAAGMASARAVADPKHLQILPAKNRIVVLTGNDLPASTDPASLVLNRLQLFQGALLFGGQTALDNVMTYIYTTMPASGTPTQKNVWRECQEFPRGLVYVNQLRTALGLTKAEMDTLFVLGSGYTP